jgi:AcrR family transcriptional regulator
LPAVPRWEADARARLQEAALDLYDKGGFEETTVAEIADRAGLTKRTFFRHFRDKREVLFWGGEDLEEELVAAVREAPPAAPALRAVGLGLEVMTARFDQQREAAARRFRIVRASPDLWERQLIKFASLAEAVARALRGRGVADPAAILAAEAGIMALRVASGLWLDEGNEKSLHVLVAEGLAELRGVALAEMPVSGGSQILESYGGPGSAP